ncbi:hypothetical protein DPMN_137033 [Dreissena polymorpha]|uniref:Uncharacterized protein n=1 Tax=Dreissena polymorpha TaxID=45954 RepID=A0A9D4G4H2_DREPO|nr:hypothetical protein DPMN_137033 [Dreissena polymorpha]
MFQGSLGRVVVKAVSDFRFIQEWLMHGTDPSGGHIPAEKQSRNDENLRAQFDFRGDASLDQCGDIMAIEGIP